MITEWKKVKLGDIASITMGQSPKGNTVSTMGSGTPLLNGPSEFTDRFPKPVQFTNDPKRMSERGDILFCVRGSTTGKMNWSDKEYAIGRGLASISHKSDSLLNPYLRAVLEAHLPELLSKSTGSTFPNLSRQLIHDLVIEVPKDINIQNTLSSIVNTYDLLISNNSMRTQILERSALDLFSSWIQDHKFFVSSTDKSVKNILYRANSKKLRDFVEVKKGKNITKSTVTDGTVPVVAGGIEPAYYHNISNTIGPIITISASGANAGFVNLYHEDIWASDCSYIDSTMTPYLIFIYLFLKTNQSQITNLQKGSAQPHVYPKDIMSLDFMIPDSKVLDEFSEIVNKIYTEIGILKLANQKLTKMRELVIMSLIAEKKPLKI